MCIRDSVLTYDKLLTSEQRTKIRERFNDVHEGSENAHKLLILEAGMQYGQVQINPDDMQLIESRRFQIEEISRFFGVPLAMLNEMTTATVWGSGVESQMMHFYKTSLKPYLTRFETAIQCQLLNPREARKYRNIMDFEDLLRADSKTRAEVCLLYTSPSPRDRTRSRMPSSA